MPYLDERNLQTHQPESLPEPERAATCPGKYSSGHSAALQGQYTPAATNREGFSRQHPDRCTHHDLYFFLFPLHYHQNTVRVSPTVEPPYVGPGQSSTTVHPTICSIKYRS